MGGFESNSARTSHISPRLRTDSTLDYPNFAVRTDSKHSALRGTRRVQQPCCAVRVFSDAEYYFARAQLDRNAFTESGGYVFA